MSAAISQDPSRVCARLHQGSLASLTHFKIKILRSLDLNCGVKQPELSQAVVVELQPAATRPLPQFLDQAFPLFQLSGNREGPQCIRNLLLVCVSNKMSVLITHGLEKRVGVVPDRCKRPTGVAQILHVATTKVFDFVLTRNRLEQRLGLVIQPAPSEAR